MPPDASAPVASRALAVLSALAAAFVAAGCAASPRAGATPAEPAPASSVPPSSPSSQAWAPPPWTPDFSRSTAPTSAPSASTPQASVPDPAHEAQVARIKSYVGAWKALLAKRNAVGVAEVEKRITVTRVSIDKTASGASLSVDFAVSLDWAKVESRDSLLVKVDAGSPLAARVPGAVGRWLTAAEVVSLAERAPATADVADVALGKHLKFDSEAEALGALRKLRGEPFRGSKPTYELAWKGANRGHIRIYTNVFVEGNFCAADVVDLITGKSCRASLHSCADDMDLTDYQPSGPLDHECAQP